MGAKDKINLQIQQVIDARNIVEEIRNFINLGKIDNAKRLISNNISLFNELFPSLKITPLLSIDTNDTSAERGITVDSAIECLNKLTKSINNKLNKLGKKSLPKSLPDESDFLLFTKSLGITIESFLSNTLMESYQTFSGRNSYDKEISLNGCVPLMFNKDLKTIRLVNFFRAVKYSSLNGNSLMIPKEELRPSLDLGRIMRQVNEHGYDEDIIYFKDINDKNNDIVCVDYKNGRIFTPKVLTHANVKYKEVFARLDYKYITKINILKLAYREILEDMLVDEIDENLIKKRNLDIRVRTSMSVGDDTILKRVKVGKA